MMSITMADVELAIRVINQWIRQSKRAEQTVRRLMVVEERSGRMPKTMQDFMDLAFAQGKARSGLPTTQTEQQQPTQEPELTDEELKELRAIKDRMKNKTA